jgi:hypothetical protein
MLAYVDHGALQHFLARRMILLRVVKNNVLGGGVLDGLDQVLFIVVDVDVAEEAEVVGSAQALQVDAEDDHGEADEPEGHKEDVGGNTEEDCEELQEINGREGVVAEEEATEEGAKLKKLVRVCTYEGVVGDAVDVVETRVDVGSVLVQDLHLDYQEGDEE